MPYLCIHRHKGDEDNTMKGNCPLTLASGLTHMGLKDKKLSPRLTRAIRIALLPGDRSTDWYTFRCSRRVDEARAFFFTALFIFVTCASTFFLRARDKYGTLTIKKTKLEPPFTLNDEATAGHTASARLCRATKLPHVVTVRLTHSTTPSTATACAPR